jgi:sugar lactone lactonase YvrE
MVRLNCTLKAFVLEIKSIREGKMQHRKASAIMLGLALGLFGALPAKAWDRGRVDVLAVLPDVTPGVQSSVEGLAVGPDGNIYVPTFGFNTKGSLAGNAVLFVISPQGKIIRKVTIANSSPHMLGLAFNPVTHALWVLDFGAGNVLQVDPTNGTSTVLAGPIANSGLNALTFDLAGNGYVSDSFNGVIWQVPPHGGSYTAWASGPTLSPGTGLTPPFGANGVEFNNEHTVMYVANTAFHQIIQIPVTLNHGTAVLAGSPSILITGINAPDGILIDRNDNIWICANQEDEIVVVDPKAKNPITGATLPKVIAKLGDFYGIDRNGIAQGFLFPASPAFSTDGRTLYVSNLTLYLPYAGALPAIDSGLTLQVKGYTVSAISAFLPAVQDGGR